MPHAAVVDENVARAVLLKLTQHSNVGAKALKRHRGGNSHDVIRLGQLEDGFGKEEAGLNHDGARERVGRGAGKSHVAAANIESANSADGRADVQARVLRAEDDRIRVQRQWRVEN